MPRDSADPRGPDPNDPNRRNDSTILWFAHLCRGIFQELSEVGLGIPAPGSTGCDLCLFFWSFHQWLPFGQKLPYLPSKRMIFSWEILRNQVPAGTSNQHLQCRFHLAELQPMIGARSYHIPPWKLATLHEASKWRHVLKVWASKHTCLIQIAFNETPGKHIKHQVQVSSRYRSTRVGVNMPRWNWDPTGHSHDAKSTNIIMEASSNGGSPKLPKNNPF